MKNSHARSHLMTLLAIAILFVSISGISSAKVSSFWRLINTYVVGEAWLCESSIRVLVGKYSSSGYSPVPHTTDIVLSTSETYTDGITFSINFELLQPPEAIIQYTTTFVDVYAIIEYDFPQNLNPGETVHIKDVQDGVTMWDSAYPYHDTCPPQPTIEPVVIDYDTHMRDRDPNGGNRVLVELGAPVAAYCEFGNFRVYNLDVNTGNGSLAIDIPVSDLHARIAEAQASGVNILISEGPRSTQVWALSSGEIQINAYDLRDASKLYEHIFTTDVCS